MISISIRSLMALTFLALVAVARAISSTPSTGTEMICSTTNTTDCYPRIFEPTKDFQVIREGQDLPPGLHVRMDIYSGLKQARLNIPMEGEEGGVVDILANIPVENAMVVVEQPETDETEPEEPAMRDQVHIKPPVFETAGKIVPPPPSADDFGTFQQAILTIKMEGQAFDSALDDLKDLSHDIYYGLEIVKDGPVLEKLVCLTLGSGSENMPAKENGRDHKAASILASAVQNNPTALKELGDSSQLVLYPNCGADVENNKNSKSNFVSILQNRLNRETEPQTLKAKVTAISGFLKEVQIRDEFLEKGGMELLLAMFLKKGEEFDIVRKRIVQLVTDTFLDEEMGAELGIWPTSPVSEAKLCKSKERMLEGGCWEHHTEAYLQKNPTLEWPGEFLVLIKSQRSKYGDSAKDREL